MIEHEIHHPAVSFRSFAVKDGFSFLDTSSECIGSDNFEDYDLEETLEDFECDGETIKAIQATQQDRTKDEYIELEDVLETHSDTRTVADTILQDENEPAVAREEPKSKFTELEFINVTSLRKHICNLIQNEVNYTAIAEHTVPQEQVSLVKAAFHEAGAKVILSPLNKELQGESSGVGIAVHNRDETCESTLLQYMQNHGRISSFYIAIIGGQTVLVHILYLWTGAGNATAKSRAKNLLDTLLPKRKHYQSALK